MRSLAIAFVSLVACGGNKEPASAPPAPSNQAPAAPDRKTQCTAFAAQEIACLGMQNVGPGNEIYDLPYSVCLEPDADPEVTMSLRRGSSRGENLVELDAMVACAQRKHASCDDYEKCYGGSK